MSGKAARSARSRTRERKIAKLKRSVKKLGDLAFLAQDEAERTAREERRITLIELGERRCLRHADCYACPEHHAFIYGGKLLTRYSEPTCYACLATHELGAACFAHRQGLTTAACNCNLCLGPPDKYTQGNLLFREWLVKNEERRKKGQAEITLNDLVTNGLDIRFSIPGVPPKLL